MKKLDLSKIVFYRDFPESQYNKIETKKKQIVLHHTVSGRGVKGDINWWLQDVKKIATHFLIDHDGVIHQLFSTKYWANHLGVYNEIFQQNNVDFIYRVVGGKRIIINNRLLNEESIGIEIDSWGGLVKHTDQKWYPGAFNTEKGCYEPRLNLRPIPDDQIEFYPNGYRGFFGYEKYTDKQIESLGSLLVYLCETFNISKQYNSDMWYISRDALQGNLGIWSHVSYRPDKSDAHPQHDLKVMLMNLHK